MKPILLFAALLLVGCGEKAAPGRPDLPASVSPGWTQTAYAASAPPQGLPAGPPPSCWKATYAGANGAAADAWACAFAQGAFEPMQRANVGANAVKFYVGKYLVVVRYSGGTRADVRSLTVGLEKALVRQAQ